MSLKDTQADILAEWMLDSSIVSEKVTEKNKRWAVHVSGVQQTPDRSVTLTNTANVQDGRIQDTGERIEHYGIQVRIRAKDYNEAYTKAHSIATAADGLKQKSVVVGSNQYVIESITRKSILDIGPDEKQRRIFTVNLLATIT